MVSYYNSYALVYFNGRVLILVVMEDGLVLLKQDVSETIVEGS